MSCQRSLLLARPCPLLSQCLYGLNLAITCLRDKESDDAGWLSNRRFGAVQACLNAPVADSSTALNSTSAQIFFCATTGTWCCGDSSCCNGSSTSHFDMNNAQALLSTAATATMTVSTPATATSTVTSGASGATSGQNTTGITSTQQCSQHDTAVGAGIGVGATIGTLVVVASAWWMFRRRAKMVSSAQVATVSPGYQYSSQLPNDDTATDMDAHRYTEVPMSELTASRVPELDTISAGLKHH